MHLGGYAFSALGHPWRLFARPLLTTDSPLFLRHLTLIILSSFFLKFFKLPMSVVSPIFRLSFLCCIISEGELARHLPPASLHNGVSNTTTQLRTEQRECSGYCGLKASMSWVSFASVFGKVRSRFQVEDALLTFF